MKPRIFSAVLTGVRHWSLSCTRWIQYTHTRRRIQKFPDWPPKARTANGNSSLPLDAVVSLFCDSA